MTELSDDERELIALIHATRIAIWTHNFTAWSECFVHAPYTTRLGSWSGGGIFIRRGWDDIAQRAKRHVDGELPYNTANAYDIEVLNLDLRIGEDMAWAVYDQQYPGFNDPGHVGPGLTREIRVFEKHQGRWKIALLGYLDTNSGAAGLALIHIDRGGQVLWLSEAAKALLADDDDLVIRNGRLRVRDSRTDKRLQAAIHWAAGLDDGLVSRRGALPVVQEAAEGLPTRVWWVTVQSGIILVSLDGQQIAEDRLDMAAVVYGLSPTQKRLARLVAEGKSLPEIAEALGVTASTARTHLQRIFDKTGIHNQPALVRALLSVTAPV